MRNSISVPSALPPGIGIYISRENGSPSLREGREERAERAPRRLAQRNAEILSRQTLPSPRLDPPEGRVILVHADMCREQDPLGEVTSHYVREVTV
jgi:hypothetical protein